MNVKLSLDFYFQDIEATTEEKMYETVLQKLENDKIGNSVLLHLLLNRYFKSTFTEKLPENLDSVAYSFSFGW